MAERLHEALYFFDKRAALFAKSCTKLPFWATRWEHPGQYKHYLKVLMQRNFVAEFHRENAISLLYTSGVV